jgi:hypothetical protein
MKYNKGEIYAVNNQTYKCIVADNDIAVMALVSDNTTYYDDVRVYSQHEPEYPLEYSEDYRK